MNKTIITDCEVVQDLLPLYIDGCCSETSSRAVEDHLNTCNDCKHIYEMMKRECVSERTDVKKSIKPISVNGWKASVIQSVLLFLSFAVLSVGITLEAYTPYGVKNGIWAFLVIIPVASFMLSLSNWYFIRLYKNKKLFVGASVLFNLFLELCFCIWGVFHFRSTFFSLDVSHFSFICMSLCVCIVLCFLTGILSRVYAKMLGKE